jgi:SsrA-binding protein
LSPVTEAKKTVSVNRKAYHEFSIAESIEAGIVLTGTEIKSIRAGRVNLSDAYAKPERGELWLFGVHIAQYSSASHYNHEPKRPRKLLLHRKEIERLSAERDQTGLTLVPLKLYLKKGLAKIELGIGKGKKLHDKRETIKRKEANREMDRAIKEQKRGR